MAFALGDDHMLASIQRGFANGLFAIALEFEHATLANVRERRTQIASIAGYCKGDRGQTGLERALYDLNPDLACQSPLIRDYCARSVKDLMIALDRVVAGGKVKGSIFDRHIEGFIAARCGGSESRIDLIARAHGDAIEELIAQVRIFEALQSTRYRGALKGLTAYYAEQLRDVLLKLKNKSRRDSALMRLDVLAQSGSFVEISRGLDLKTLRERDAAEYRNAILGFLKNANFVENLRMGVQPGEPKALEMGGKAVAIVAHAILGFSAMVNFMRLFL
jgi:hypothetical protein